MEKCRALPLADVRLSGGLFAHRFALNRAYVSSLRAENLLQAFFLEAGIGQWILRETRAPVPDCGDDRHWGWESPTCQIRGHFLGHWLSAAAAICVATGDAELQARADFVVAELARCQARNGGEWASPIPEKYLDWLAAGTPTWAPHYVHHKTLMGLHDMHVLTGSAQALEVADRFAGWFHRWSGRFTRAQMDDMLDVETGGMLEAWADLYGVTGSAKYLDLIERYTRRRLFEPLLEGRDVLTNMHANTTIPEAHGAARCYEVTGDERWRRIAEAYWRWAVAERGTFCTGGQTSGEVWTPPMAFAARRGDKNQEHCTVYNMIRLADYLFRWTGEAVYADYIERNLYNGILAQQHPGTGMVTYFLPLEAGGRKRWGRPTYDFWCCHGTLVQAHSRYGRLAWFADDEGFVVSQYIPSEATAEWSGVPVRLTLAQDTRAAGTQALVEPRGGSTHRPRAWVLRVTVACESPTEFALKLRLPSWMSGPASIRVNAGAPMTPVLDRGFAVLRRVWSNDTVALELPKRVSVAPIPDEPGTVAFVDGPIVLAGLCDREVALECDPNDPAGVLVPDNEREWGLWQGGYRTVGQRESVRFRPLLEVVDEPYTLYFPVRSH